MTTKGKIVLVIIVLALAGWGLYANRAKLAQVAHREPISKSDFKLLGGGQPSGGGAEPGKLPESNQPLERPLRIAVNVWGGYAPGIVANGGLKTTPDSIYARKGLNVDFVIIDDWAQKDAAFTSGKVDLIGTTCDYYASQFVNFRKNGFEARAVLMHDWSRGGDGIVSKKSITTVEGLAGKKIATTRYTPSHFLLLYLLYNSGLSPEQITQIRQNVQYVDTAGNAAKLFVSGKVDAAVTWEPDLSNAVAAGNGRKLVTTESVTNLITDVIIVNKEFADKYPSEVLKFIEGWFEGVKEIQRSPDATAALVAKSLTLTSDDVKGMLSGLRLTDLADNKVFFGIGSNASSQYDNLFTSASTIWRKETLIDSTASPEEAADKRFVAALAAKSPTPLVSKEKFAFKGPKATSTALISKHATIHFATGSAQIMPDSKPTLDEMAQFLRSAANAYLRIEGNTDSVGNPGANKVLSLRRAQAVESYMVHKFGMEPKRFITIGNGQSRPVATNATGAGREANRRTDMKVIPNL